MVTALSLWFVRHKPTGNYIPRPEGRSGRGGSHLEPSPDKQKARIFYSERSAKIFISTWVQGKFIHEYSTGYDYDGNRDDYENVYVVPQPNRIKEDMEIIRKDIDL